MKFYTQADAENLKWTEDQLAAGFMHVPGRCGRCGGAGGAQKWAHTGWTCYQCNGTGQGAALKIYTPERRAKLDAANAKRRATIAAKNAAKKAAAEAGLREQFPVSWKLMDAAATMVDAGAADEDVRSQYGHSVLNLVNRWRGDSDVTSGTETLETLPAKFAAWRQKKHDWAVEAAAKKAKEAAATPVSEIAGAGVTITGTLLKVDVRESTFGTQVKLLVEDDRGFKLWGTMPRALTRAMLDAGQLEWRRYEGASYTDGHYHLNGAARVTMVGNVSTSDDRLFGFISRPRKAAVLDFTPDENGGEEEQAA